MGKMKKERREVSCIWMLLTSSSGKVPLESNNSWDLDHRQKRVAFLAYMAMLLMAIKENLLMSGWLQTCL
jgi:hypothetical protein